MALSEGKHLAEVTDAEFVEEDKDGVATGRFVLIVFFKTGSGDSIDYSKVINDNTRPYVEKDLDTMGFGPEMRAEEDNMPRLGEMIRGNRVQLVLKNETYKEKTRLKIAFVNHAAGNGKKLGVIGKKALHAMFSGMSGGMAVGLTSQPRQSSTGEMPPHAPMGDDEGF